MTEERIKELKIRQENFLYPYNISIQKGRHYRAIRIIIHTFKNLMKAKHNN
jgi:hypothetical protein